MRTPSIDTKPSCPRNQARRVLQCSGAKLKPIGSLVQVSAVSEPHGEPPNHCKLLQGLYSALQRITDHQHGRSNQSNDTATSAVTKRKPVTKKLTAPTKKASVLAREAQAAKKRLLKLRADTKKAIEAAKREVVKATEAAKSAARFEKQAAKDKLAAKKAKAAGVKKASSKAAATKVAPKKAAGSKTNATVVPKKAAVKSVTKKRAPAKKVAPTVAAPEASA